jgi:Mlc titration factor MtfA (ptsG expression regulator)
MRNGEADGVPPLPAGVSRREWEDALLAAFDDFCARVDAAGADDDALAIDPYASESPGEFFAVLSETFFEVPEILYRDYQALYALFVRFYRQNPLKRKTGENL